LAATLDPPPQVAVEHAVAEHRDAAPAEACHQPAQHVAIEAVRHGAARYTACVARVKARVLTRRSERT